MNIYSMYRQTLLAGIWSTLIPRVQGGDGTVGKRVGRISLSALNQREAQLLLSPPHLRSQLRPTFPLWRRDAAGPENS